jgi:signal peptidase I
MVMMNDDQRMHDDVLTGSGGADRMPHADGPSSADKDAAQVPAGDAADNDEEPEQAEQATRGRWSFLTEMVVLFAVALTIALLIKTFVVQPFFIPSGSMENTLLIGDKVLVNKLVYHLRPIDRGDIVVFDGEGSWDPPAAPSATQHNPVARVYDDTIGAVLHSVAGLFGTSPGQTDYIKRVIGVPGDHVICCNDSGQITVNGVPLSEKSYIFPGARPSQDPFNVVIPPGRLWVMGDNREESADSRLHDCAYSDPEVTCYPFDRDGTIPENKVIGRAFMIVWPPSRLRILPIPSTFEQAKLLGSAGRGSPASHLAATGLIDPSGAIPVKPSAPYVPLSVGFAAALPLTLVERRLRLKVSDRLRSRWSRRDRRGPR